MCDGVHVGVVVGAGCGVWGCVCGVRACVAGAYHDEDEDVLCESGGGYGHIYGSSPQTHFYFFY